MSMNSFLGTRFTTTGGGYFRFFPYSLIRILVEKSDYTMTYFHQEILIQINLFWKDYR